jgi:hypothetical protein
MCAPAARRLVAGAAGLTRQFYLIVEAAQRTLSLDNVSAIADTLSADPRELSTQLPPSGLGPVRVSPGQRCPAGQTTAPAKPSSRSPYTPTSSGSPHATCGPTAPATAPRPDAPRPADPRRNGSDPMADDRRKPRKSLPLKLSHPGPPTHGSDPMAKDNGTRRERFGVLCPVSYASEYELLRAPSRAGGDTVT